MSGELFNIIIYKVGLAGFETYVRNLLEDYKGLKVISVKILKGEFIKVSLAYLNTPCLVRISRADSVNSLITAVKKIYNKLPKILEMCPGTKFQVYCSEQPYFNIKFSCKRVVINVCSKEPKEITEQVLGLKNVIDKYIKIQHKLYNCIGSGYRTLTVKAKNQVYFLVGTDEYRYLAYNINGDLVDNPEQANLLRAKCSLLRSQKTIVLWDNY